MEEIERIKMTKEKIEPELLKIKNVVGVGIGLSSEKTPCIKVCLQKRSAETEKLIPKEFEGIKLETEEVGEVVAFDSL